MTPSQKTCKCQNNSKSLHPYMYQYIFCYIFSFWIVVFLCRIVLIVLCVFQALTIINFTLFICVCCNSKCHYYSSPDYYWMDRSQTTLTLCPSFPGVLKKSQMKTCATLRRASLKPSKSVNSTMRHRLSSSYMAGRYVELTAYLWYCHTHACLTCIALKRQDRSPTERIDLSSLNRWS